MLYEALGRLAPSPVVELNRAVALSMAQGPAAALRVVDELVAGGQLAGSHLLPSVRGELLTRLGRTDEARAELARASNSAGTPASAPCWSASSATSRELSGTVVGMTPEEIADLVHLRRARDLMDRDYAQPLDVPAMARAALMSPAHFSRKFRAAYGETPYTYLMTRRIERAKALLRQGMSVTDTCVAVGCTSLGSFSSRFTEIVGETPSQYRARDHRDREVVPSCVSMVATRPRRTPVTV